MHSCDIKEKTYPGEEIRLKLRTYYLTVLIYEMRLTVSK